jgi:FKBP-type peptidyl-prolyl cis-trans isomerase
MKNLFNSLLLVVFTFGISIAKDDKPVFTKTSTGMQYYMVSDIKGDKAEIGKFVSIQISTFYKDSLIFDSRKNNDGKAITFPLSASRYNGDLSEAIQMMSPGDSLISKVLVDSIIAGKQKVQPWMKPGGIVTYYIKLESVKTQEQINAERNADNAVQNKVDDGTLNEYFTKNNIKPLKTASGLYYVITKQGAGPNAKNDQTVYVNYTGHLLNGNVFDSNVDPKFNHQEPFSFMLGRSRVIRGWDEGLTLLNKGAKATLYIPSSLAYGNNSPSSAIPPNSILIFDIELIDIK